MMETEALREEIQKLMQEIEELQRCREIAQNEVEAFEELKMDQQRFDREITDLIPDFLCAFECSNLESNITPALTEFGHSVISANNHIWSAQEMLQDIDMQIIRRHQQIRELEQQIQFLEQMQMNMPYPGMN